MYQSSRILICDDEDVIRTLIAEVLNPFAVMKDIPPGFLSAHPDQKDEYRLDFVDSGEDAIEAIRVAIDVEDPYALIFMDVRLKGDMDGVEAASQIWQLQPDVQIVISSGHHDYTWENLVDVFGKTTNMLIMPKPFDCVALQQITYVMTEKWQLATRKEGDERAQQLADKLFQSRKEVIQLSESRNWAYELARESEKKALELQRQKQTSQTSHSSAN